MKAKFLAVMLLSLTGAFASLANADELKATQSFTAGDCYWSNVFTQFGYVTVDGLFCDGGVRVLTRTNVYYMSSSCYVSGGAAGYNLVGSSCSNYALYKVTTSSSSVVSSTASSTASSVAPTACELSGKAGVYVGTYDGRTMNTAAPSALAYCSPCGITTIGSGTNVTINCASR